MASDPFIGQITIFSFNFPPRGWALCNGQLLPINQNQALFSLLGTMYGGNGQTNFALPNLQGRVPFHMGNGLTQGQAGGETAHTLTINELPAHTHVPQGSSAGPTISNPSGAFWGSNTGFSPYNAAQNGPMSPQSIGPTGGSQPHLNMSPYLTLNFSIALVGIFPSQN